MTSSTFESFHPPRAAHPRGFVLVGVTMFILVLTILGLSLFSLSGFEAQFLIRSLNNSQAFNAAAGGMERARFALVSTDSLLSVKNNLTDGVEYAVAVQNDDPQADDTTGTIQSNGDPVWVRVRARRGASTVLLQARYSTGTDEENYRRLITARRVTINNKLQTYISGKVGQENGQDMSWNSPPLQSDTPGQLLEVLDDPLELAKLAPHLSKPFTPIPPPTNGTYILNAGTLPTDYRYFRLAAPQSVNFNVDENDANPTIWVRGTAIWLVPARATGSLFFQHRVTVRPIDPAVPSVLVIMAGTLSGTTIDVEEIQSAFFEGGILSGTPNVPYPADLLTGVPIVIVTPGIVEIGNGTGNEASFTKYLSIYAGRVNIDGPTSGSSHFWNLPSMDPLVPDEVMDLLYGLNILPNASVGGAFLTFDSGTWQILSESSN